MKINLNSNDLRDLLTKLGFKLTVKEKAVECFHPEYEIFYLKKNNKNDSKAVYKEPLVIHNKFQSVLEISDKKPYHNNQLKGFPKRLHNGLNPITYGLAIDIRNYNHLIEVLEHLKISSSFDDINYDLSLIENDDLIKETTKKLLINARIGQGKFRKDLLKYWEHKCAVTGLLITSLLKASHIKPWKNSNNDERLDHFNGILLTDPLDSLFDKGYISFDDEGDILICEEIKLYSNIFNIHQDLKLSKIDFKHKKYLAEHRKIKFKN